MGRESGGGRERGSVGEPQRGRDADRVACRRRTRALARAVPLAHTGAPVRDRSRVCGQVGDSGEMLAARTACNIVCGGFICLALGNGVFNGIRLFMCTASVAFLSWQRGDADVVITVEQPESGADPEPARPPKWHILCATMALAWSQVAISLAVGNSCMQV